MVSALVELPEHKVHLQIVARMVKFKYLQLLQETMFIMELGQVTNIKTFSLLMMQMELQAIPLTQVIGQDLV